MTTTRIRPTALAVIAAAAGGLIVGVTAATAIIVPAVQPCATEDSTGCYWDADARGNGEGESFYVDADDTAYYADTTCADAYAAWADLTVANYDQLLKVWQTGAAYDDSFRADNLTVLTAQLDSIECD